MLPSRLTVARDKASGKTGGRASDAWLFSGLSACRIIMRLSGAIGSVGIDTLDFWPLTPDWFSEQFKGRVDRALVADVESGGFTVLPRFQSRADIACYRALVSVITSVSVMAERGVWRFAHQKQSGVQCAIRHQ